MSNILSYVTIATDKQTNKPKNLTISQWPSAEDWLAKSRFIYIMESSFTFSTKGYVHGGKIPDNLSVKSKMQNDVYRKIAFIKKF